MHHQPLLLWLKSANAEERFTFLWLLFMSTFRLCSLLFLCLLLSDCGGPIKSVTPGAANVPEAREKAAPPVVEVVKPPPEEPAAAPEAKRRKVAVAVMLLANKAKMTAGELEYLTGVVRQAAAMLPKEGFLVMTRENITTMLPPDTRPEDCVGNCEVETGRKLGAEWLLTGEVLRFGSELRAIMNLHHVPSGNLTQTERVVAKTLPVLERRLSGQTLRLLTGRVGRGNFPPSLSQNRT